MTRFLCVFLIQIILSYEKGRNSLISKKPLQYFIPVFINRNRGIKFHCHCTVYNRIPGEACVFPVCEIQSGNYTNSEQRAKIDA